MITSRRSLITGLVSLLAAPAIVRAESLMKLPAPSKIIKPVMAFESEEIVWTASGGNQGLMTMVIYDDHAGAVQLMHLGPDKPLSPGDLKTGEIYTITFNDEGVIELDVTKHSGREMLR